MSAKDSLEHFFGMVKTQKRGVHGTSSTANSIMAAQLIHLRLANKPPKALGGDGRMWQDVAGCGRMWQDVAGCGRRRTVTD